MQVLKQRRSQVLNVSARKQRQDKRETEAAPQASKARPKRILTQVEVSFPLVPKKTSSKSNKIQHPQCSHWKSTLHPYATLKTKNLLYFTLFLSSITNTSSRSQQLTPRWSYLLLDQHLSHNTPHNKSYSSWWHPNGQDTMHQHPCLGQREGNPTRVGPCYNPFPTPQPNLTFHSFRHSSLAP